VRPRKNVPTLEYDTAATPVDAQYGKPASTPTKPSPNITGASMINARSRVRCRPKKPGAAFAARSLERRCCGVELVRDDPGFFANDALGPAVAPLRKQPAELVDHFVGIEPDALGIVANVAAGEDALRPSRQVVLFQRLPELGAQLGLGCQLCEGDAFAFAGCPKDRAEGFFLESHNLD
jgi:hypothetical protein